MTAKEAYELFNKKIPNMKVVSCIEYDKLFVFEVVSKDYKSKESSEVIFDCLCSVNKTTGEVRDFKPFYISVEEYRSGKKVTTFE